MFAFRLAILSCLVVVVCPHPVGEPSRGKSQFGVDDDTARSPQRDPILRSPTHPVRSHHDHLPAKIIRGTLRHTKITCSVRYHTRYFSFGNSRDYLNVKKQHRIAMLEIVVVLVIKDTTGKID